MDPLGFPAHRRDLLEKPIDIARYRELLGPPDDLAFLDRDGGRRLDRLGRRADPCAAIGLVDPRPEVLKVIECRDAPALSLKRRRTMPPLSRFALATSRSLPRKETGVVSFSTARRQRDRAATRMREYPALRRSRQTKAFMERRAPISPPFPS